MISFDDIFEGAICCYAGYNGAIHHFPLGNEAKQSVKVGIREALDRKINIISIVLEEEHKQRLVQYILERNINLEELLIS